MKKPRQHVKKPIPISEWNHSRNTLFFGRDRIAVLRMGRKASPDFKQKLIETICQILNSVTHA